MPPQYMTLRMAPVGHWLMHRPQLVHFSGSMEATLSLTVMAPEGQLFSHLRQAMQPTAQAWRVTAPLALEEQLT